MFNLMDFSKLGDMIPRLELYAKDVVSMVQEIRDEQRTLRETLERIETKLNEEKE